MSFKIRNLTSGAISVDDLGIEIAANQDYDMLFESPEDVQASGLSGGSLNTEVTAGNLIVLDPKDGTTPLSQSDSIIVISGHNDPNWGIKGGKLNDLDDVNTSGASNGNILQLNNTGSFIPVSPNTLAGNINLGDLQDVTDNTGHTSGEFYILEGDGAGNHTMVNGATDSTLFVPFLEDTTGSVVSGGSQSDITLTYNTSTNKIDASVDDNFLRNTGDSLDSGTLMIVSGASIFISSGGSLTITDSPTNNNDAVNKAYVDSFVQGADVKNSVLCATTPAGGDLAGTYNATGGTGGTGSITGIPTLTIDGQTVQVNDRIIVKDQNDATQNGIYVVTAVNSGTIDIERASDHDGTPSSEVSAGNLAFVEQGAVNGNTSWVVTGTGELTLNSDNINWTQFSGVGTFTDGIGLGMNGTEFYLDVDNLSSVPVTSADEVAFNDKTDNITKKRSFSSIISDLGLYTSSNLTASDGVLISNGDIQLDITGLATLATPTGNAEIVLDAGGSGTHNKVTISNLLNALDVVYNITSNGILARTANDTYASRSILSSTTAGDEGISIVNGDGVSGNIEIGVDITGQTASANNMTATDELLLYNGTNNVKITGQQISDGVATILGSIGNVYTTIQGDSGSASASNSSDTLSFVGATNGGISTTVTNGSPDQVSFTFDLPDLTTGSGTVDLTDTLAVGEGTSTVKYTFNDVIDDLGIVNNVGSLTGILVSDGSGTYTTTTIAVESTGSLDGLSVTNANGVSGSPTVGLDIDNNAAAGEELSSSDKLIGYNSSNTANETFTGQEIASGVSTMLGLSGLSITTINGQQVLTLKDTTRANKILSVGDSSVSWAENRVSNNDWLQIGSAVDADSGYIVPMNATIVKVTGHTENNKGHTKPILLYIDTTLNGTIGTFNGSAGEDSFIDTTLDIDVNQGQKLRLRGGTGGKIEDTVITVWLKWRG